MAKNRELSQVGSLVTVNDSMVPGWYCKFCWYQYDCTHWSYALDVHGTANITGTLNIAWSPAASQGDATALAIALG